jgi:hypothetical protein
MIDDYVDDDVHFAAIREEEELTTVLDVNFADDYDH